MKIRAILILSLFAISLPVFGGAVKPDDEKAVLAAEKQLASAMVKADIAVLEKLLSDDLSYTHSSASTQTKADVIQVFKTGSTKYTALELNDAKVRQFGNVIVTTHPNMTITSQPNGVSKLYVTFVWAKQAGGWQLVSRQATKLP